MSLFNIVCLFKFSPKYGLPNYRSGISVEFLAVKMTVSCLATDGRHLGSGLVTSSLRIQTLFIALIPLGNAINRVCAPRS